MITFEEINRKDNFARGDLYRRFYHLRLPPWISKYYPI